MKHIIARLSASLRSSLCWDKAFSRLVLMIALPMIFQDLMAACLHIVDGMMVSGLGDAAYSAVIQANRFSFLFYLLNFGASSGFAIFFSQYWGAKDIRSIRQTMGLALRLASGFALCFSLAGFFFPHRIMPFFLPPGESFTLAVSYLRIVAPTYLLSAWSAIYSASIKAAEKTYIPMIAVSCSLVVDTLISYVLIYGLFGFPALGVQGAAIGTVVSSAMTLAINLAFAYGKKLPAAVSFKELFSREKIFSQRIMKTVLPVICNEGLWGLGMVVYAIFYGTMGDVTVAAVGVSSTVSDLLWVFLMAMTHAAAIIIGKALGKGDKTLAFSHSKRLLAGSVVVGLLLGVFTLLVHPFFTGLFSGLSAPAREKATTLLLISALVLWLRAFNCLNVVGILRAGGDTVFSLKLDILPMWCIGIPIVGIMALWLKCPIELVYPCTLLDELVKCIIGIPHFRNKQWMHVLTEKKEDSLHGNA